MIGRGKSNLAPRSDCHRHTVKREHYTRKDGFWKPKMKFETEEDAKSWIKKYKMIGYSTYTCKVCGKWHVGLRKQKE